MALRAVQMSAEDDSHTTLWTIELEVSVAFLAGITLSPF